MSKTSLTLVKENSYFCTGIFAIGVYLHDNKAILFDSGSDEQSAKNASDAIEAQAHISAIINTHCHPDHCGGNPFFQKKIANLKIYAAHDEKEFIESTSLASRCFCSGAAPFAGLKNKHIVPQKPCTVTNVMQPYQDQTITIDGADFKIITLPGHTPGSIGIITPDNILYSGDAIFGQETLNKHPILFYTDIGNTLASFKKLASLNVDACVLYHGGMVHDLSAITRLHETKILETKNVVFDLIKQQPLSPNELTQKIMQKYKIPDSIVSFTLTQTAMKAYLSYLEQEKAIELVVRNGLLQASAI